MINCLIVGAGGATGAMLRYLITLIPLNTESGFPIKTFMINIAGSFLIGIAAVLASRNIIDSRTALFLRVGLCGGFTTFSSFAIESEELIAKGSTAVMAAYAVLSLILGIIAVFLGERLATHIL